MSEIVAEGIIRADALRDYLEVFTPLVDEGRIHFNDDGLVARVVDPANVALINPGKLDTTAFESYDAPGSVTIGTSLVGLVERIKPADGSDLVHLAVDMETRRLQIEYGRASVSHGLIDPESIRKEPDQPDLDLPNWIVVEGGDLDTALTVADLTSDHLSLRANPDDREVEVFGQGDTDDSAYTFDDEALIEGVVNQPTESLFSLDYFEELVEPIPDSAEVTLRFGEEHPVQIEWEGAEGALSVDAMLAPRIQSS